MNLARLVTARGVDADDDTAVGILADHFGYDQCDVALGRELASGEVNFHASSKIISVMTKHKGTFGKLAEA